MIIVGISAYYHDSAACLINKGEIIAAAQEERFTRIKHDNSFPINAIKYCISEAKINSNQIDFFVFYDKPFLKFERLIETYLAFAPKGFLSFSKSMPLWIKEKLFQKKLIIDQLNNLFGKNNIHKEKILFSEHHLSHAASAYFPSPFKSAAILTLDGVGEWTTTSMAVGSENKISNLKEINFPHSLGLLYSAFTYYLGFKVNSGEYKLMGLAPYGQPKYVNLIKDNLIDIKNDGSFKLNLDYFDFCVGLKMTNNKFNKLFFDLKRVSEDKLSQKHMDVAASIQKVTEEIYLKIATHLRKITNEKNLCLAGGVALNCVANGVLQQKRIFENLWIQPASGDAGGALGAALAVYYLMKKNKRVSKDNSDMMKGSYLGPSYSDVEVENKLQKLGAKFKKLNSEELIVKTVEALSQNKAIGWMNGRMEFGPRALGNRSIIADPRSDKMQKILNLKIKFRESFRPFAPSIIIDEVDKWFDLKTKSPYMLLVAKVKDNKLLKISNKDKNLFGINKLNIKRSQIPAVTHVDNSARIQTVEKKDNEKYYNLIKNFSYKTGCPLLVNTSFNIRGEPIVCSPLDAFKCFMGTDLDVLVIENFFLLKEDQDKNLIKNYKDEFELD